MTLMEALELQPLQVDCEYQHADYNLEEFPADP
jgi:hypothetical protein